MKFVVNLTCNLPLVSFHAIMHLLTIMFMMLWAHTFIECLNFNNYFYSTLL